jgi:hypothetical protein
MWWYGLALGCLTSVSWPAGAGAQTQTTGSTGLGLGYIAIPQASAGGSGVGQTGMAIVPMSTSSASTSPTALATPAGRAAALSSDPMGFGYVYGGVYGGAAIPMTQAQAGLLMLSTSQRMLGLGNGQMSGVRPGAQKDSKTGRSAGAQLTAAHTRNANIPGGQAARYFGRGIGLPASSQAQASTGRPQPYYQRQMRYFPQTAQ